MSGPEGPTGIITLKKIADSTYEQYGAIVLSDTGVTQVTLSAAAIAQIFVPNIEEQITWIEDFGSRIVNDPDQTGGWQGGSWHAQGGVPKALTTIDTVLDGAVRDRLDTIAVALPEAGLSQTEKFGSTAAASTNMNRNPTLYMRWAQTSATSAGAVGIGWAREGEGFTDFSLATAGNGLISGIYFRCVLPDGDILACCRTHPTPGSFTRTETTKSCGVSAAAGVYHACRIVVTGAGAAAEFFIDGVSKAIITTDLPLSEPDAQFQLGPSFGSTLANEDVIDVDYMALSQQRTP